MDTAAVIINKIETMRRQIEDRVRGDTAKAELRAALREQDKKLLDIELVLLSKSDFYSDDKYYVEPFHVYLNLIWLSGEVGTGAGDVAGGAEFRPTDASLQVLAGIETDLDRAKVAFKAYNEKDLAALNQLLAQKSRCDSVRRRKAEGGRRKVLRLRPSAFDLHSFSASPSLLLNVTRVK